MSDYYIRSWDPDSTYPANPQEGDVCYTITLDQSWAPVAGVKNDNLVKEEVYQSGNWVEVGGGGGGGDFKTVNVTVTADGYTQLYTGNDGETYDSMFVDNDGFHVGVTIMEDPVSTKLVMFGNSAACTLYGDFVSATGDASWDSENYVLTITGDCSIVLHTIDS
jgi:hypothetical protein